MALLALVTAATAGAARAQTGAGYDLDWNTLSSGGAPMTGSGYALTGTVGIVAAEPMQDDGGRVLRGGFWAGLHVTNDAIFRSGFETSP